MLLAQQAEAIDADSKKQILSLVLGLVFGATAYAGGFGWLWRLVEVFLAGDRVLVTFTVNDANVQRTTAFVGATGLPVNCWMKRQGDAC